MKKIIIIFLFIITSCSTNKVVNNHGTLSLEKKLDKISLDISNINDVITVLGPPSTKSTFDGNIWMYIERKKANQSIFMLGKKKVIKNNVLLVQFNNQGMLINKEFYKTQYNAIGNGDYKHNTFHFSSTEYFKLSDSIANELSDLSSK